MHLTSLKAIVITLFCCCLVANSYAQTTIDHTKAHAKHVKHHKNNNIVHRTPATIANPTDQPPNTGNYALRVSQQPAPFIAFGENILNKNQVQAFLYGDHFHGPSQHATDALPYIVYGLTDNSSLLFALPIAASYRQGNNSSHGLEDATIEYEYAFYTKATTRYEEQATIVAALTIPTGSNSVNPPTGAGSPGYFIGTTYNRTYNDWLGFASPGVQINTTRNGNRSGNQYAYQAGIGRNIAFNPGKWLLTWMVEADGQYSSKNKVSGFTDPNSGGNIIYITPSLFYSRNNLMLQAGFGVPCVQQLNGSQTINNFFVAANIGWTFN